MNQLVITQANNGFVIECRANGTTDIEVVNKLSQLVKLVKATFKTDENLIEDTE